MMMLRAVFVAVTVLILAAIPLLTERSLPPNGSEAAYAASSASGPAGIVVRDDKSNSPNPNDNPNDPITDRGGWKPPPGIDYVHVDNEGNFVAPDNINDNADNDNGDDNDND